MKRLAHETDVAVIGGGISGLCAALAAARHGAKTILVHGRPMLGGNAGSEIRMHICGADYHMSRPNARETGIVEEIQLRNKRRNPTHNFAIFDSVMWEMAMEAENLTLLLNTVMDTVSAADGHVHAVEAYQQTTETRHSIQAKIFIDATGDGLLGALAGAPFTVGREACTTYGESYAPVQADCHTMGNSLMFLARDAGCPVSFLPPKWAYQYSEVDLKTRLHCDVTSGYWWIELGGGALNVTEDYEQIRDELLKTVYGIWDHIKNRGDHGAGNLDLEWVGLLPGKRESRRFLGEYVLTQQDCEHAKDFADTVAYGGWPMDVHAVEGFLNPSEEPTRWIALQDVYAIPYRCFYTKKVDNLYFCGRTLSASHMAFASTRVMGTCGVGGQAVGTAAALAAAWNLSPEQMQEHVPHLQKLLVRDDCYLPNILPRDEQDLAPTCTVEATHTLAGWEANNLICGFFRTLGQQGNAWAVRAEDQPELRFGLPGEQFLREIRLVFDSNLSQEITISINREVRQRQGAGLPAELVQQYQVSFWHGGQKVHEVVEKDNEQRLAIVPLVPPVLCDEIRIGSFQTHGCPVVKLFRVMIFGDEK